MRRRHSSSLVGFALLAAALGGSCATASSLIVVDPRPAGCRTAIAATGPPAVVSWIQPEDAGDRVALDGWCAGVGPAVVAPAASADRAPADSLGLVSWNVNVGAGDLAGLVRDLRAGLLTNGRPVPHLVLLLQEAYREGAEVPGAAGTGVRSARRLQPDAESGERRDVEAIAASLGLALYYAPSMRNGAPHETQEDRGNAILSTLPLSDLAAIELPFERQRRVAVEATVHGRRSNGDPWTLRVTSAHLENRAPARRLWLFATMSRVRQARGLVRAMRRTGAAVLGGDLNTWGGFHDAAYRTIAAHLPIAATDRRATFAGLARLDHLLFRLPDGWSVSTTRLGRFGSDHHALLAEIAVR
jgi:endonuclease/exonuclease/phosphatase family metal-dependent hydrolase